MVDRVARHQGVVPDDRPAEEVIRSAVLRWRDGLSRWLGDRLDGPLDWDESGPAPCFTDKPGWDGYGGTLLLAAHDEHPELPCRFDFTVRTQDITGEEVEVGSSVALLDQLELLAARYRLDDRPPEPAADGHSLSAAAGGGLAILRRLAECSVECRVPMRLDF